MLNDTEGVALFSGTIHGLFGQLFDKGKFSQITELYSKLKSKYHDKFYIEIQRHGDQNEFEFEKFNLTQSDNLKIGYSYDVTISKLANATAGSHELSFQINFNCRPKKKTFKTISCPSF